MLLETDVPVLLCMHLSNSNCMQICACMSVSVSVCIVRVFLPACLPTWTVKFLMGPISPCMLIGKL